MPSHGIISTMELCCPGSSLLALILLVTVITLLGLTLRKQIYKPQTLVDDKLCTETLTTDIFDDFNINFDFRNKPRMVSSKKGAVAADHSRCSEKGGKILEVCAAIYPDFSLSFDKEGLEGRVVLL